MILKKYIGRKLRERMADHEATVNWVLRHIPSKYNVYTVAGEIQFHKRVQKKYLTENGRICVLRGPFQGMQYPDFAATGSTLYPKLSGIYEEELVPIWNEVIRKPYDEIIDVGCAEGYYIIGLAIKKKDTTCIAYDIDEKAQMMCRNMAQLNGVDVDIKAWCTPDTLLSFADSPDKKRLLICDCEGYERELFTEETVRYLHNAELVIEAHDWRLDAEVAISQYLMNLFQKTHDCNIIRGKDDYDRAYKHSSLKELEGFSIKEKYKILEEVRPAVGCWVHIVPRKS